MDLKTRYMGLELPSPVVASASPLSKDLKHIKALAQAGAGAVVMHSVFQEQLVQEALALHYYLEQGTERFAESTTYFPPMLQYKIGPEQYLENIAKAKKAVDIPIIGSINGISPEGLAEYARDVEQAGADGIELNVYLIPTNPSVPSARVEQLYLDILGAVKGAVKLPVAMKLAPFFSSIPNMARRLDEAGVDALALFNRFYQPDLDVDNLAVVPRLVLSTSDEMRLPLRWLAILHGQLKCSLAGTTGVHTGMDAAKMIMAGADVAMMTSALLQNGIPHMTKVRDDMAAILEAKGYSSVAEARGVLSQKTCPTPGVFERTNYMKVLENWATPWESV